MLSSRYWVLGTSRDGTFSASLPYVNREDFMRAYLGKLTPAMRLLLALPLIAGAYPVVMILLPAVVRAIVPEAVRSVLSLM
jgi:hypothetical protein